MPTDAETDPLRRLLRLAIAAKAKAQKAHQQAEFAAKRASDLVTTKQTVLAGYEGVDALLKQHREQIERAFAASGGARRRSIPPDLMQRVAERDAIADELRKAQSGMELVKQDLDAARVNLATAERKCASAAAAICLELAVAEADLLRECQQEVWAHTNSLRGLGRLWTPDSSGKLQPIKLPWDEVLSVLDRAEPMTAPNKNPETLAANKWKRFHTRLQEDWAAGFFDGEHDVETATTSAA
jgi:hypothetical protein